MKKAGHLFLISETGGSSTISFPLAEQVESMATSITFQSGFFSSSNFAFLSVHSQEIKNHSLCQLVSQVIIRLWSFWFLDFDFLSIWIWVLFTVHSNFWTASSNFWKFPILNLRLIFHPYHPVLILVLLNMGVSLWEP